MYVYHIYTYENNYQKKFQGITLNETIIHVKKAVKHALEKHRKPDFMLCYTITLVY